MSVTPAAASVVLGATQQFAATVVNTSNTNVSWSVNGVAGGNAALGTVSAAGLYTAPQILPAQASFTIRATSQADASKSGTATGTITSDVMVTVTPGMANVELGATQQFAETVSSAGNPSRAVTWTMSGAACGAPAGCGTISPTGLYTAPQILPSPASVTVTATSTADPSKNGASAITATSNLTVSVSGPAAVDNGTSAQFTATVTPAPGSNPDRGVNWGISGPGCAGAGCGTITNTGFYTAPLLAPVPPNVTVTAISVADAVKTGAQNVGINSIVSVSVTPSPGSALLETSLALTPSVAGTADQRVTWDVNGIVGGDQATVGAITNPGTGAATYFAPVNMPAGRSVTVHATSVFDPSKSATVTVNLDSSIGVSLAPSSQARAVNRVLPLVVQVAGSSNPNVSLAVNGVPGGDAIVGRLCFTGSNPCFPISSAASGDTVDYLAPASLPANPSVLVQATSQADATKSGSSTVQILAAIQVTLTPASVTLPPSSVQSFTASQQGTSSRQVTWAVNGISNGDVVVGQVCVMASNPCQAPSGTVTDLVEYRTPAAAPAPPNVTLTAKSADDPAQSASASVAIATGPFIQTLLPASVTAGAGQSFVLKVQGSGFIPSSPGPASTILFGGTRKATTCLTTGECTASLTPGDAALAGNTSVQVENPGAPAVLSNAVNFVAVPLLMTEDVIALSPGTPAAIGKDIVAVEPTTAGAGAPPISIQGLAIFANNACNGGGSPIAIARPAAGTNNVDICVGGDNIDVNNNFTFSGPGDLTVINKVAFGVVFQVRLTLLISSTTQPGARTLFVENVNKDKAAASGAVEVKP